MLVELLAPVIVEELAAICGAIVMIPMGCKINRLAVELLLGESKTLVPVVPFIPARREGAVRLTRSIMVVTPLTVA